MSPKKVLVTGVYGLIAGDIYSYLQSKPEQYEAYGLARRRYPSDRVEEGRNLDIPDDRFFLANLTDLEALERAMQGIDVVVQMAADPNADGDWESILASNVIGARNVFEAAHRAGVKRLIFASSIMVSWGYLEDEEFRVVSEGRYDELSPEEMPRVTHESAVRPTSLYPASKVWGEAVGRYYADIHEMSVICLRIGWVNREDHPHSHGWARGGWCSRRDMVQMVERSIQAPEEVRFDLFYVLSNNKYNWADIDHARRVIGYAPEDSAEERLGITE